MNIRSALYWLSSRSTAVLAVLLLGVGVILAFLVALGVSNQQSQLGIGIAAASAFLAAVSAIANLLQAVEAQREGDLLRRPYVVAYFSGSSKATIDFRVENAGNSPARDVVISFDPAPMDFAGRPLNTVSVFSKPIGFLPAGETIRQFVDVGYRLLAAGKPTHFLVKVRYSGPRGQLYSEQFDHDIECMKQATVPQESIEDHLSRISDYLKKIAGQATELLRKARIVALGVAADRIKSDLHGGLGNDNN